MEINGVKEFEVLGYKLKVRPEQGDGINISPEEVVSYVKRRALEIQSRSPQLEPGKLATLLALELARENLSLEHEYKTNINKLRDETIGALSLLEEVSPSAL